MNLDVDLIILCDGAGVGANDEANDTHSATLLLHILKLPEESDLVQSLHDITSVLCYINAANDNLSCSNDL